MRAQPRSIAWRATQAIKALPNHGLAEYCLALLAQAKKAPREQIVKDLQASAKGDPLSLPVWTALATQYQGANDTANTLVAFKQMLRVAPTNQKLREELFKYFLQSGHPETALEVADEGLKIDPYNADLYDLKSNACLFLSDFKCAVDALETLYATDSTKADTLFFTKITVAAQQKPDTARLLKWAKIGNKKFPQNVTLLKALAKAYNLAGPPDSAMAVTQRLVQADPNDMTPALELAQTMINNKQTKEALPLVQLVAQKGDSQAKENAAALLYQAAAPMLQEPTQDYAGAADLLRTAVTTANPSGKVYPAANYLLGLATLLQVPQVDPKAEKGKSCDLAKQESSLLDESEKTFTAGQSANQEVATRNLGIIAKYKPRAASMIKAYCKGK